MRRVEIQLHYAPRPPGAPPFPEFPTEALKRLYEPLGIELRFPVGAPLARDPVLPEQYQAWVVHPLMRTNPHGPGDPAHLIIANRWQGPGGNAALGRLLHRKRGVAAIFSLSQKLRSGNRHAFAQVAAHEIGHMLNLIHADGLQPRYYTTMGRRTLNPALVRESWELAGGAFNFDRLLLPVSPGSRHWLAQPPSPQERVQPWASVFRDPSAQGEFMGASRTLRLELIPERDGYHVGSPFFAEVQLENTGKRSRTIDNELHPDCDQLRLRITRPDGQTYVHRPREITCTAAERKLAPKHSIRDAFILIDGPDYAIFPDKGVYRIEAATPYGASDRIEIEVAARGRKPSLAYRRYVADGAPALRRHLHAQSCHRMRAPRQQPAGLVPLLGYLLANQYTSRRRVLACLRRATRADAPKRVREDAYLLRAALSTGDTFKRNRDRALEAIESPSDRCLECFESLTAARTEQ